MRWILCCLAVGLGLWLDAAPADAQSRYPDRPIRLVFGFGTGQFSVRVFSDKLAERLGQPVIIESASGAAGNIAADRVAASAPDGYTIGLLSGANIVLRPLLPHRPPHASSNPPPVAVSLVFRQTNILAVGPRIAPGGLNDLLDRARAEPGRLTFGHLGAGSVTHLSGEFLKVMAKVDIRGVPYRTPANLLADLVAGHVALAFSPAVSTMPLVRDGKLRALAVTSRTRAPFAPDVPTLAESGYPRFETNLWFGLFAPAETPQPIVDRLSREASDAIRAPDVRARFAEFGLEPIGSSQAEFEAFIITDTAYWTDLIRDTGIGIAE